MLIASFATAQLPNGSVAPDFTATDVNGNQHRLYDYLDQGYTVILDISATGVVLAGTIMQVVLLKKFGKHMDQPDNRE